MFNYLNLNLANESPRRLGLTRNGGGFQPIRRPKAKSSSPPPEPEPKTFFNVLSIDDGDNPSNETGDDIYGPPVDSDNSDEEQLRRTNINPTLFRIETNKAKAKGDTKSSKKVRKVDAGTRSSTRSRVTEKENDTASPKRKSQEESKSSSMGDVWDSRKKKSRKTTTYGSQSSLVRGYGRGALQPKPSSSLKLSSIIQDSEDDEPSAKFHANEIPEKNSRKISCDKEDGFRLLSDLDTPISTPKQKKGIKVNNLSPTATKELEKPAGMKLLDFDGLESPTPSPQKLVTKRRSNRDGLELNEPLMAQHPVFMKLDGLDELAGGLVEKPHAILVEDFSDIPSLGMNSDKLDSTGSPQPRCPMCKLVVNEDYLAKFKSLSTMKQAKFCQSHQIGSSKAEWKSKGYPEIDWGKLDDRIDQHHKFIKKLIGGADSHFRTLMEEKVKAGKDRNMVKSSSNLTPGYYGPRGLRAISENIMRKFTPLLEKNAIKDKLVSARGTAGFVQSVVVPEVATLLIKVDMDVDDEEARDILTNSAIIGEIMHEEVKDIVTRRVGDSDEVDDLA